MKPDIHPEYHHNAKIICACGQVHITGSTKKEMHVDACAACHPFYTGKQKFIDTAGRLERFKKRAARTSELKTAKKTKKARA